MKKRFRWIDLFLVLAALGCAGTLIAVLCTPESQIGRLFFYDYRDTGMDFFHSIEYVRGGAPYAQYHTLYPPLANLFFYVLFRFVPAWQHGSWPSTFDGGVSLRGGALDLRTWQPTMLLYILFILLTTLGLMVLISRSLPREKRGKAWLLGLFVLLGNGWLYALERGNIILIALLCTLFFLLYYDADKPLLRELALIALAVAAGLKLYPALFGLLLIYEKKYARAARCVGYGVAMFVLPALCFREGLAGIGLFWQALREHTQFSVNIYGFSFGNFINACAVLLHGGAANVGHPALLGAFIQVGAFLLTAALLACGFLVKKRWQRVLCCCAAMLAFADQGMYASVFFLLPLVMLLREEEDLDRQRLLPFLALTAGVCMLPVFDRGGVYISWYYLRYQFCMLVLVGCCLGWGAETLAGRRADAAFAPRWKQRVQPALVGGALGLMVLVSLVNGLRHPAAIRQVTAENAVQTLLEQRADAGKAAVFADIALPEELAERVEVPAQTLEEYLAAAAEDLPATLVTRQEAAALCAEKGYEAVAAVLQEEDTVQVWAYTGGTMPALVRRIQLPATYAAPEMRGTGSYALLEAAAYAFSGGGVMSPQIRILPDTYTVTVLGAHLDQATVEVYSASKGLVSRGTNAQLDAEGAQLTFTLKLKEMYGDLEIRVLNYSNTAVAVQEITVDAYREAEVQE